MKFASYCAVAAMAAQAHAQVNEVAEPGITVVF